MVSRVLFAVICLVLASQVFGQNGDQKKNQRPVSTVEATPVVPAGPPVYFFTFEKPEFLISYVHIEHDENGAGTIVFRKSDLEDEFTRELRLSSITLGRLESYWKNLGFLDSAEDYQSHRDYAHLGQMTLQMSLGQKQRVARFNWTENPDAKSLTDEYRKIGYQYVWMFDMEVAIRNQQLETPKIMKRMDAYLRRGEISDPTELVPYFRKLGNDERLPLIARNHAKRLADSIEKKVAAH